MIWVAFILVIVSTLCLESAQLCPWSERAQAWVAKGLLATGVLLYLLSWCWR